MEEPAETAPSKHSDDLARQFKRVVVLADAAWEELEAAINEDEPVTRAEARYKDWASVLLRYHDAMERVSGKDEGPGNLGGMKAGAQ